MTPKHPPDPPMTLGNMREQGFHHLIAFAIRMRAHQALIDFRSKAKCAKCGAADDVRHMRELGVVLTPLPFASISRARN
jgi:hypothetical protein